MAERKISVDEIIKHNSPSDAWVVINGTVWDVTDFAPTHPGGVDIILEYLGQDATRAYSEVHSPGLVSRSLDASKNKGQLDETTVTEEWRPKQADVVEGTPPAERENQHGAYEKPPLDSMINLYDFEEVAQKLVTPKTWAYYSGAANDCLSLGANMDWYKRIWFRPRVLRGVRDVDTTTTVLGEKYSMPIFSSPAALAKLSHPDGELAMARGAVAKGTTICVCYGASYSLEEITQAMPRDYPKFYQLYFDKDRAVTERKMREAIALKPRAILATVDLPVVGKREADERIKIDGAAKASSLTLSQAQDRDQNKGSAEAKAQVSPKKDNKGTGLARVTGSFVDPNLTWRDVKWLISLSDIPVFVKGIQCAADARMALEAGCKGIYISNHGGRAVDTAQPSILTLLEIQANCPEVMERMEVFIDGGIRRGTDVLKAICLGASAVCLGRPFLYSVVYGQEGMERALDSEWPPPFLSPFTCNHF